MHVFARTGNADVLWAVQFSHRHFQWCQFKVVCSCSWVKLNRGGADFDWDDLVFSHNWSIFIHNIWCSTYCITNIYKYIVYIYYIIYFLSIYIYILFYNVYIYILFISHMWRHACMQHPHGRRRKYKSLIAQSSNITQEDECVRSWESMIDRSCPVCRHPNARVWLNVVG